MKSLAKLTALEVYYPEKKLTNKDLEALVDTNDEWIVQRTGIHERHISEDNEYSSTMAIKAVENLINNYHVDISNVDMIIVSTYAPDFMTPSVSALVQNAFNLKNCGAIDVNAACAGFVYSLTVANALITCGSNNKILVIASETVSKTVDYTDRNTCILFGDGAGAALIEKTEVPGSFINTFSSTNGALGDKLYCSNLSNKILDTEVEKERKVVQDGRAIYNFALKDVYSGIKELLVKSDMSIDDIDWFIPHSANKRIIEALCKKLNFPIEKALTSVELFGNTSSASIPLALSLALKKNQIKKGDTILLYGFGGGVTQAGVILNF